MKLNTGRLRILLSLILLVGITYLPKPVLSQEGDSSIQNLIVNGGFEGGFQEDFGVGYGWGGFSNGNAVVGWNFDDWDKVVAAGRYAQRIEIKDALDLNRYAGIYQTVSVVPGEQYKLTIKGLVRSEEGDIGLSDYGYRVQYAVDYNGDIAWELVPQAEWQELPWDEQPLSEPADGEYRHNTYETTLTAKSDELTLFIRGWKKWLNNGTGIYDFDEISIVGPAPAGFQSPVAQTASTAEGQEQPAEEVAAADFSTQATDTSVEETEEVQPQTEVQAESLTPADTETSTQTETQPEAVVQAPARADAAPEVAETQSAELPVSGQGSDDTISYVVIIGAVLLLTLFASAIVAAVRQRTSLTE